MHHQPIVDISKLIITGNCIQLTRDNVSSKIQYTKCCSTDMGGNSSKSCKKKVKKGLFSKGAVA